MPSLERVITMGLKDPQRQEVPSWLTTARWHGHRAIRRVTRQRFDGGVHVPAPPPPCPPGWHVGPPSFVGIGGQRCGTTRWFDLIIAHPEVVHPPLTKELDYFDRFYAGGFTDTHTSEYHDYFPRDGNRKVGEWSPLYLCAPWVPRLLAKAAPDARLLVLLRDPIERYLSGLQHDAGLAREHGAPMSELAPLEAFMRGFYHAKLTRFLTYFDRSQLLVLQYERCVAEPAGELRRTFEFLELEDVGFQPDVEAHPHRQPQKPALDENARESYVEAYHDDVLALKRDFPQIDLSLWPNFAHLAG
jgi:hypothetical protein